MEFDFIFYDSNNNVFLILYLIVCTLIIFLNVIDIIIKD